MLGQLRPPARQHCAFCWNASTCRSSWPCFWSFLACPQRNAIISSSVKFRTAPVKLASFLPSEAEMQMKGQGQNKNSRAMSKTKNKMKRMVEREHELGDQRSSLLNFGLVFHLEYLQSLQSSRLWFRWSLLKDSVHPSDRQFNKHQIVDRLHLKWIWDEPVILVNNSNNNKSLNQLYRTRKNITFTMEPQGKKATERGHNRTVCQLAGDYLRF
jgi:hypothetical protein